MMRAVGPIPNATIVPPPVGIEFMGNEVPPEYVYDQGLNYPPAENYGYLSTAYESPGEWGDHHSIFGLDGQDLHYMGLQAESLPYVYYAPGYVYAQSSFNQYMPYVPGAITGLDGSFVGTQQYLNSPSYQHPISSPAYIPVIVQPSSDFVPTSSMDPFFFSTGASVASRPANASTKVTPAHASVSAAASSQLATLTTPLVMSDTSQLSHKNQTACRPSEGSQINIRPSNQSSSQEPMMLGGGTHWHQGVSSTGLMQSTYQFSHGRIPFGESNVKVAAPSNRGFTNWQPNVFRGASQDKQRQALQVEDIANTGGTNPDILGEQNKGPRKNRSKDQSTSSVVELAEPSQRSDSDAQGGCIIISPDYYNKDNFPVDYPDAKFFVIKSYSEDDVHKSVKYNVWSSTPNGNKRLDSAYDDAQRKSVGGKSRKWCPVFLFFSVNASGQFCGLAEMVGRVDFDKDMDFWQQDKWSGSFPVNWHIIKDVPNANLRHIILENNEHKPVTNSRDTQEIPYSAGINMLKIFKAYLLRTSILDDFMFYEERQKKMLENKFRHLGRSYNASLYVPAFVSQSRPDGRADQPPRVDENQPSGTEQIARAVVNQSDDASEQPSKYKEEMLDDTISRPLKIYGKHSSVAVDQSQRIYGKQSSPAVCLSPIADGKHSADAKDLPPIADGMQPDKVVQPQKADAKLEPTANPSKSDEKQSSLVMTQLPKAEIKPPSHAVLPKVDGKQSNQQIDQPLKSNGNPTRPKVINGVANSNPGEELVKTKLHVLESSADKDTEPDLAGDGEVTKVIIKTGMPSVDPKQVAAKSLGTMELKVIPIDFVKVGSLQIKVGLGESSSRVLSIGTMSGELKGPRQSKKGKSADSQRPTK